MLKEFQNDQARKIFGMTTEEAISKNICINCKKEDAYSRCTSRAGRKVYKISGLSEECFDSIFEE